MQHHPTRDFVAEAIADYEAMAQEERSKLLLSILEDQPYLMGFLTNLADDFSDSVHEALVESTVILINAFVSAGIPVGAVPQAIIDEVVEEKVEQYEETGADEQTKEKRDSPLVFEDLRNRALFHSNLDVKDELSAHNFELVLNTIVSSIERAVAVEINSKSTEK